MKYYIIQFSDGILVVCHSWVDFENKVCYVPSDNIRRKLRNETPPNKGEDSCQKWETYDYIKEIMSHDDLDFINYRVKRSEEKGTTSATDVDKPRKRPLFQNENLRRRTNQVEKRMDDEISTSEGFCDSDSNVVASKPLLKRQKGFEGKFPVPPSSPRSLLTTSSSQPHEREADDFYHEAKRYKEKGTRSVTEVDKPRKRILFDSENLRRKTNRVEKNSISETETAESSSDSDSHVVASKPRLKRQKGFRVNFPIPPSSPTSPTAASSPQLHERDAGPSNVNLIQDLNVSEVVSDPSMSDWSYRSKKQSSILNKKETNDSITVCECHCKHQEHWSKELLRVMLRIEQRLTYMEARTNDSINDDQTEELFEYAAKNEDEIERLFNALKDDAEKRKIFIEKGKKEVSRNKKNSIERILLSLAPPDAWKAYSKLGQRGKRSATVIGVNGFLVSCLRKIHRIQTTEEIKVIDKLLGEVLKRMGQIAKRKSTIVESIISGGTSKQL